MSICTETEPTLTRFFRGTSSVVALVASVLLSLAALTATMPSVDVKYPFASYALLLISATLCACCGFALRQPARLRTPVQCLVVAGFVALAFSDLGRGLSGWTYTTPSATHYIGGALPAASLLGLILLGTGAASTLAQRNSCKCG